MKKVLSTVIVFAMIVTCFPMSSFAETGDLKAPSVRSVDWVSGNRVSVRWSRVAGADGYIVYRASKEDGKYVKKKTIKGKNNARAIIKNNRNKVYYYAVKAYKKGRKKNSYSKRSEASANVKYAESDLGYLFPKGPPKSRKQMNKFLTKVKLPIRTSKGKRYIYLRVHKKLKKRIKACFKEMYDAGFRVRKSDTGSYVWRMMRTVKLRSHHSYGCVVDINWRSNPMVTIGQIGHSAYRPGKDRYSVTDEVVAIWKKHGFSWGGDWTEKKDYMHFTFTNN